jgi:hypothetical protein
MAGKSKARGSVVSKATQKVEPEDPVQEELDEQQAGEPASARNIAGPTTSLAFPPKENVGKLVVELLADPLSVPALEELEKIAKGPESQGRAPLMTVIQAVLRQHGGGMTISELAAQVKKHWNRTLPASPYTLEEFMYVVVRNADSLRVRQ